MIPKSWKEVTLDRFYLFRTTLDEIPQNDLEGYDLRIKRACFLSKAEVEDILQLPDEKLDEVDELIVKPLPTKFKRKFKLNGQRYRVLKNIKKGESWRYQGIMNEAKDKDKDNLHRIMFYCCQPINFWGRPKKIEEDEMQDKMEEFKGLSIALVNPIVVFFWTQLNNLTEISLQYSEEAMKTMTKKMSQQINFLNTMDG